MDTRLHNATLAGRVDFLCKNEMYKRKGKGKGKGKGKEKMFIIVNNSGKRLAYIQGLDMNDAALAYARAFASDEVDLQEVQPYDNAFRAASGYPVFFVREVGGAR